jgi:hypothetical protein
MAPSHGTVYVQPPISKAIKANQVLTEVQFGEIKQNIQRRHSYLKVMYQKEFALQKRLAALEGELKKWKASIGIQIEGPAQVNEVMAPLNPDKWVGSNLRFRFRITESANLIVLTGYRPKEWGSVRLIVNVGSSSVDCECEADFELKIPLSLSKCNDDLEFSLAIHSGLYTPSNDSRELSFNLRKIVVK